MLMLYSNESPVDSVIADHKDIFNIKSCILSELGVISLNHGRFCR